MGFKQVTKSHQSGGIGNAGAAQINTHEAAQCLRVVDCVFHRFIGKAVPAQLLAWLLTMVMLAISVHFFDFPLVGSLAVFLAADFVALLALVGVGLFISSLCRTQQQAILGVFTFQMPAVLLSGFISPIDNMPVILQYLTYLNPLRFFLVIAKGVLLKNMDMYHVLINLIPLALIAVLTLSIAGWTFKSKLE